MQNLTIQSGNLKQYFVHALKSLGLRHDLGVVYGNQVGFVEMKEAEILQFLENPQITGLDLRKAIKLAIVQQFQHDAGDDGYIQEKTVFDRQTVKQILTGLNFNEQQVDTMLRGLTAAGVDKNGNIPCLQQNNGVVANTDDLIDEVVDGVITAMMKGVDEQKTVTFANQQAEAKNIWTEALYAEFEQDCANRPNFDQNVFNAWKKNQQNAQYNTEYQRFLFSRQEKVTRAWVRNCLGDDAICNVKPNQAVLQQLKASDALLNRSLEQCKKRCEINNIQVRKLEDELTMEDVLIAAGNEKTQIVTFFQTRSLEQACHAKQNPKFFESKKENKIGNVLGEKGRKYIKEKTGTGAVLEHDVVKSSKNGKKGPWRGYRKIIDRIMGFIQNNVYGPIQAIGLSRSIVERETGHSFSTDEPTNQTQENNVSSQDLEDPVKTDYDADKKIGTAPFVISTAARDFYAKTKARILNDKITIASFSQSTLKTNHSNTAYFNEFINYLQQRVNRGEEVLETRMPDPQSPNYQKKAYYDKLETYIYAEKENQNNQLILNNIKSDKVKQANDFMADSIYLFSETAKVGVVGEQEAAKREMAKHFFNLDSQVKNGNLSGKDLDDLTNRFFQRSGAFQMHYDLSFPNGRDVNVMTIAAMNTINQFVVKDLQKNSMKSQYQKYQTEMNERADQAAIEQNKEKIQTAAAEEMGMTL